MFHNIFFQFSVLLGITVSVAVVVRLLRQPLMVAYIAAGIFAGPLFLNLIHGDEEIFRSFSQFGVVLLLFIVGLSLDIRQIKQVGLVALTTGLGQLVCTSILGFAILLGFGIERTSAIYIAVAITFSSTIIIIKLLSDKKALETVYGRYTIGLLLVQDIIAILLMLFLTSEQSGSLMVGIGLLAAKAAVLVGAIFVLSRFVLPSLLHKIADSSEFLFLFTLAWCFGAASIVYWAGFSIEIGAVFAGISLGSSPYHHEIASRIKPLRDFFIVLFFVILGSELSLTNLTSAITISLTLSLFILVGHPLVLYSIYRWHKFTRRNSFLGGLAAAQVSEFGFIMMFTGLQLGYVTQDQLAIFTIAALITIFFSSYLITYNDHIYRILLPIFHLFGKDVYIQQENEGERFDVWVAGYHRIGWKICSALKEKETSFAVIDYHPEAIKKMNRDGVRNFYGDISDVEFLGEMPFESAKLFILTVPEPEPQITMIKHIRQRSKKALIIGNLNDATYVNELYDAGANYVMMPHLLGGNWIADVLSDKAWTKKTFESLRKEQHKELSLRTKSNT